MSAPQVELEVSDHVAVLTLADVARRNAMSVALGDALRARVDELRERADVRAVILTGAGGAFSAGGDLGMLERLRAATFEEARRFMLDFYGRYLSVLELPVPTVAAVEGPAIGAGLCVALACDLCVVAEDAKLALNFVQLGLHPGMGATYFVPRRVGPERAAELLLTGRRFSGTEAAAMGLVLEAAPSGGAVERARALAAQLAAAAPLSVRALKQGLGPDRAALAAALEREALAQAQSYGSLDLAEGLSAAAARRAPTFSGR
jgi:enoyl-CoA hydratase/carnithine racemase